MGKVFYFGCFVPLLVATQERLEQNQIKLIYTPSVPKILTCFQIWHMELYGYLVEPYVIIMGLNQITSYAIFGNR